MTNSGDIRNSSGDFSVSCVSRTKVFVGVPSIGWNCGVALASFLWGQVKLWWKLLESSDADLHIHPRCEQYVCLSGFHLERYGCLLFSHFSSLHDTPVIPICQQIILFIWVEVKAFSVSRPHLKIIIWIVSAYKHWPWSSGGGECGGRTVFMMMSRIPGYTAR